MSGQLNSLGVIKAFADNVGGMLATLNLGWMPLFGLLHVVFFYLHYMFASQTAHVGALYSAFCAMMLSAGRRAQHPQLMAGIDFPCSLQALHRLDHTMQGGW
jgi:DASS family divalent anion:Na+ symporter